MMHVINQKYSAACTHDQAQRNKLSSYFLANAISSQDSKQLIANAREAATARALNNISTNEEIVKLRNLYHKAAKLAISSHRLALNGSAGWNA